MVGGCGIDERRALTTRSDFRRQSGFLPNHVAQLLHHLHVSLYNSHTAISSTYRATALLNRRLDLLFQSSLLETCQVLTKALGHLQTEQTATQTLLLNHASRPLAAPSR